MEGMVKIQDIISDMGVDAVIITDPFHMRYLSGFRGGEGILYISPKQQILITDSRYTEAAQKESSFTVLEENRKHRRTDILAECMKRDNAQALGYEDESLLCSEFVKLTRALPGKTWIGLGGSVRVLRMVKTEAELEYLRKAEAIGDAAFSEILKILRPGLTELEVAAELEYRMKKSGALKTSFDTIVASGLHSSMPHAVPDNKKLEYGDFVTMDFGCCYEGYCSDMTRTVVIGKATKEQKKIYQTVLDAQLAALEVLEAGKRGREVDRAARELIAARGYGAYFGHGLGHSVGLYIHEEPRLSPGEETVLVENMIETVEPGIYIPGFGGVRIEDMVVVKKGGYENLTHSPKELLEL